MKRIYNKRQTMHQVVHEFNTPATPYSTFTVQYVKNEDSTFAGFVSHYDIYISGEMYSWCLGNKVDLREFLITELMLAFQLEHIAHSSVYIHVKDFSINYTNWR